MVGVTGVGDDREGEGRAEPHVTDHVSFCRICNAMCGIVVTVERTADGERVERVRGDDAHPLSRGYTCPKGRALGALHHDPRRLDAPVVGRGDERRPAPWTDVLDDLAARLAAAVEAGGRRQHRHVPGQRLCLRHRRPPGGRTLPPRRSARPRSTPPPRSTHRASRSWPSWSGGWSGLTPVWDHERSRLLVLFGCNPVVSHGHSNAIPDPVDRLRAAPRRRRAGVGRRPPPHRDRRPCRPPSPDPARQRLARPRLAGAATARRSRPPRRCDAPFLRARRTGRGPRRPGRPGSPTSSWPAEPASGSTS